MTFYLHIERILAYFTDKGNSWLGSYGCVCVMLCVCVCVCVCACVCVCVCMQP